MPKGYVYIMSNFSRSTYYVGVTSNIYQRVTQHKNENGSQFCAKYHLTDLIYLEEWDYITDAIQIEKVLKKWKRKWKDDLIRTINPDFIDLSDSLF